MAGSTLYIRLGCIYMNTAVKREDHIGNYVRWHKYSSQLHAWTNGIAAVTRHFEILEILRPRGYKSSRA